MTETKTVTIKGLDIQVREITDGQIGLLAREYARMSRSTSTGAESMKSAGRIMDILESAVVTDEDKDRLYDLTIAGDLNMEDLLPIAVAFKDDKKDEAPATGPQVRRGRPKRS